MNIPDGLSPGILIAPLVLSRHPIASTIASASIVKYPFSVFIACIIFPSISKTIVSNITSMLVPSTMSINLPAYSGPVSSSLKV